MWSCFESGEGGGADYGLVTKRAVGGGVGEGELKIHFSPNIL